MKFLFICLTTIISNQLLAEVFEIQIGDDPNNVYSIEINKAPADHIRDILDDVYRHNEKYQTSNRLNFNPIVLLEKKLHAEDAANIVACLKAIMDTYKRRYAIDLNGLALHDSWIYFNTPVDYDRITNYLSFNGTPDAQICYDTLVLEALVH